MGKPKHTNKLVRSDLFDQMIDYILDSERGCYDQYCEENGLDPFDINGNSTHIYAIALILADLEYEK